MIYFFPKLPKQFIFKMAQNDDLFLLPFYTSLMFFPTKFLGPVMLCTLKIRIVVFVDKLLHILPVESVIFGGFVGFSAMINDA